MYTPSSMAMAEADVRDFVAACAVAQLVTVEQSGRPHATLLPIVWDGDRVVAHLAIANPQWRAIVEDSSALLIVQGPDAYVSPSFYPSKHDHGRVVPTWNYSAVHLAGRVRVHRDETWLRAAVDLLTQVHESGRADPWATTDAPDDFVAKQLRAIVGVEVLVEQVHAKEKLSQNRTEPDRRGVVAGLQASGAPDAVAVAAAMQRCTGS